MRMTDDLSPRAGVMEAVPTAFGYIGVGIAFGIIAKANGFSLLEILLLSMVTYGGSAQFIMVSMMAVHASLLAILLSVFLVNSRMILMSTVVAPYFKSESMMRNIVIGSLITDETFALGMNKLNYTDHTLRFGWYNAANLFAYLIWAVATVVGGALGTLIVDPQKFGMDFAIVAMFIGLLYLQVIADKTIRLTIQLAVIGFVIVIMVVGLIFIPKNALLLLAAILGCSFGVVLKHGAR